MLHIGKTLGNIWYTALLKKFDLMIFNLIFALGLGASSFDWYSSFRWNCCTLALTNSVINNIIHWNWLSINYKICNLNENFVNLKSIKKSKRTNAHQNKSVNKCMKTSMQKLLDSVIGQFPVLHQLIYQIDSFNDDDEQGIAASSNNHH